MGQKVNPHGLRVGVNKDWNSKWYAGKNDFADFLIEDQQIRNYVKKTLYAAGVASVVVERPAADKVRVVILAARPGMVIGRAGDGVEELKKSIVKMTGKTVEISIEEVRRSELDAQLTAESIAQALERRVSFRRAMKQAIQRTMKANAKGIKVLCSGRLGGAEIARSEKYSEGNVPLHTLRADIDYGFAEADTTYERLVLRFGSTMARFSIRVSRMQFRNPPRTTEETESPEETRREIVRNPSEIVEGTAARLDLR